MMRKTVNGIVLEYDEIDEEFAKEIMNQLKNK